MNIISKFALKTADKLEKYVLKAEAKNAEKLLAKTHDKATEIALKEKYHPKSDEIIK